MTRSNVCPVGKCVLETTLRRTKKTDFNANWHIKVIQGHSFKVIGKPMRWAYFMSPHWPCIGVTATEITKKIEFWRPHCCLAPSCHGILTNIRMNQILSASRSLGYMRASDAPPVQPFKVVDFGANRKRPYSLLLVSNSNVGPVYHRFW